MAKLAFPAPRCPHSMYEEPDNLLHRPDLVFLTTTLKERIPAVLVKPRSFGSTKTYTIIYSHGNAEDIGLHLPYVDALADRTGCTVLSYEYVGYSLSMYAGATPSEEGCLRSADAAWRYATEELQIPPGQIIIFGRSIGSGPAVDLASRQGPCDGGPKFAASPLDVAGVLLQSPIASGARAILGTAASIVGYPLDIFRNYQKVGKIRAPVAIIHGTIDGVVPCANGRDLHGRLQRPFEPYWMEGRGHNDMEHEQVIAYAGRFIASLSAIG